MNINVHSNSMYVWVSFGNDTAAHCTSLHLTATHCNTLQHTAPYCNTLQPSATRCNKLQHTAMHCDTLQLAATPCNTLKYTAHLCACIYLLIYLKKLLRNPSPLAKHSFRYGPSYVCQSRHVGVRDRTLEGGKERERERERERGREKKKERVKEICASTPTLQHTAKHYITMQHTAIH